MSVEHLEPRRLLRAKEVAAILQKDLSMIYRWAGLPPNDPDRLPCIRLGAALRFDPKDVVQWIEARKE